MAGETKARCLLIDKVQANTRHFEHELGVVDNPVEFVKQIVDLIGWPVNKSAVGVRS